MENRNNERGLQDMEKTVSGAITKAFITMEAIFVKNPDSPIAREKSSSRKYTELVLMLHEILQKRLAGEPPDDVRKLPFTKLFALAEMILYSVAKTPEMLLEVAKPAYAGDALVCHSLNVAFLSCKVGLQMALPLRECTELGVAAMLHDIGMTKIDAACYSHSRELSKEDQKTIEMHPQAGYAFFENLRNDFPWLLSVILEEHKRENDRGYGAVLEGELHTFSRIVGMCDSFEALTHERPFRKPFQPSDAMKAIIADKELLYSKVILRSVIESIGIYPVGSLVKLNNNKIGQVLETVPGSPLRPIVCVVDESGKERTPERIDLSRDTTVYVSGLVYSDDYARPQNGTASGGR
jgi:HD-GYP domain-containing protein (c-di-GMP phosphodiesterase class II)